MNGVLKKGLILAIKIIFEIFNDMIPLYVNQNPEVFI